MKQSNKRGFTLIELLVVMTIISVLAAILFPAFVTVREKARQTACLSNEKQIGLAFSQYAGDYDDLLPVAMSTGGNGGCFNNNTIGFGWAGQIWPYNKSLGIYKCLSDQSKPGLRDQVSYGYNRNLAIAPYNGSLAKETSPSVTVQLFEVYGVATDLGRTNLADNWNTCGFGESISPAGNGGDIWGPGYIDRTTAVYDTGAMGNPVRTVSGARPAGRHSGGSNFLFADGHAKWLRPAQVSPGGPPSASGCNQDACPNGTAASTDKIGQAPANFVGTFSPL